MRFQHFIDSLPILGVFLAFAVVALIMSEGGYRLGHWWQERTPDEKDGPTNMIVGALLALMAFLLAITMSMASDRFDTRRGLVLAEANSVGTTYLRAGYLPEPAAAELRDLLREYVPLRIVTNDLADLRAKMARSTEIHAMLWSITEGLARANPESQVLAIFIESLNETIDLHETRTIAGLYARVPETILILLLLGSMLTLWMVGYNAGLTRRRSPLTAVVLIVILGAVITLVIDLDRPRDGFLTVSQQPLLDLLQQVESPSPRITHP
jgi:membrane protein DedA with SNARE-associated domain